MEGLIMTEENKQALVTQDNKYADLVEILKQANIIELEPILSITDADPKKLVEIVKIILKRATDISTVNKREISHLKEVVYNTDAELRKYFRKNLPRNPIGATDDEVKLIYAEQRFINASKRVAHLITVLASDEVFEFKLALENLEKTQVMFSALFGKD